MIAPHRYILSITLLVLLACRAIAGGGPQNVLIVVNARSQESLEIGNLYRRARDIPYRQVLALSTSTAPVISYQTYLTEIEQPIRQYLTDQGVANEITAIVLTRGVPVQVDTQNGRSVASLLAALDLGKGATRIINPYLDSSVAFSHYDASLQGMYLVTLLNGYHTQDVRTLIAQGKLADGQAPDGRFIVQTVPQMPRASNTAVVDLLTLRGLKVETDSAPPADRTALMGYFSGGIYSGITRDVLATTTFRPGAIVDYAQSYGAAATNFDDSEIPVLLPVSAFVQAGAAGVHGVVGEPGLASFPMITDLKTLLDRYTSGFSLAESYYAALPALNWQNIIIGDPLCTPYAVRPAVSIETGDGPLSGTAPIRVSAVAQTRGATINRIDLYLDDRFQQTLYEVPETRFDMRIGGRLVQYTLPRGADLRQMLEGLAAAINAAPDLSGADGVRAVPQVGGGTLLLISRTPGAAGNGIPVTMQITADVEPPPVTVSMGAAQLSGGGVGPTPARGTLSFIGRRIKPGDEVTIRLQNEDLSAPCRPRAARCPRCSMSSRRASRRRARCSAGAACAPTAIREACRSSRWKRAHPAKQAMRFLTSSLYSRSMAHNCAATRKPCPGCPAGRTAAPPGCRCNLRWAKPPPLPLINSIPATFATVSIVCAPLPAMRRQPRYRVTRSAKSPCAITRMRRSSACRSILNRPGVRLRYRSRPPGRQRGSNYTWMG